MITVDDSGWGSILGGVMIGVYDCDTKKFKSNLIPIKYFQEKLFSSGLYRKIALEVFLKMWKPDGRANKILLCRGTILDSIADYLVHYKYPHQRIEIVDPLQSLLEEKFAQSLVKIGVPRKTTGAHCLTFDDAIQWIKEDPKRKKYVKTGWDSWKQKYSKMAA